MPSHDHAPSRDLAKDARERAHNLRFIARIRSRKGRRDDGEAGETVPIRPDRPDNLTGGAAAALEFDE